MIMQSRRQTLVVKIMSNMEAGTDIDFILTNFVGGRGLWQWLVLLAMWPINFAALCALVLHMFTAYAPRHR